MRVYIDMDGVIVDFDSFKSKLNLPGDEIKRFPGAYLRMDPMPGAIAGVRSLIGMGFDVWIATKPPTGIAGAYADKVTWILAYLPELKRKIVITHDKSLLIGDFLIDDRPHKANAAQFVGRLIHFRSGFGWPEVLSFFRSLPSEL